MCSGIDSSSRFEWLETNGLGGFASSTIAGVNTRRYHGLLTAATKPPGGRFVLLSKIEETIVIGGQRVELSTNRYSGVVHPSGYRYMVEFRLDPFPVFTFEVEGVRIVKRVFMVHDENTTAIDYEIAGGGCVLELRPLIAFRDYHSTTHANSALNPTIDISEGAVSIQPYGSLPRLHFAHNARRVEAVGEWYFGFDYAMEQARGLDHREDLFCPLVATFDLKEGTSAVVIASLETHRAAEIAILRANEVDRRARIQTATSSDDSLTAMLVTAADQFIVRRGEFETIIAGYHWFMDWGRDTMISLPGLTLVTGRFDVAKNLLLAFAQFIDRGMLPNCFPDAGNAPEYNTVDAALWFIEAVRAYVEYSGDRKIVPLLYPKLLGIIDCYRTGTRYDIHADNDGLIAAGNEGTQLTWMDARVNGRAVTPRHGKPVEIQALWYNALRIVQQFAHELEDPDASQPLDELASRASESFNKLFWNEDAGCLYDVVRGDFKDASIRPNQVLALSLTHSMVALDRAARILVVAERELLTPFGLRTLAPSDLNYRGKYEGPPEQRDAAYHQGTVWPWLLGPFMSAYQKVHGESSARVKQWLSSWEGHLREVGLGQVSEIFEGDAPHLPCGCIAQAWSVGELLRVCVLAGFTSENAAVGPTAVPTASGNRQTDPA